MARASKKREPIKVTSYIHVKDDLVDIDTLTPKQQDYVGACITRGMLNTLNSGQAVFTAKDMPPVEDIFT